MSHKTAKSAKTVSSAKTGGGTAEEDPKTEGPVEGPTVSSSATGTGVSTAGTGDAKVPTKKITELSTACQNLYRQFMRLRPGIPFVFQDLKRSHDAIDADVRKAIELGEKFLATCEPCDRTARVKAFLARDMSTRFKRYQNEVKARLKKELVGEGGRLSKEQQGVVNSQVRDMTRAYVQRVDQLCAEAMAISAEKSADHCNCLGVLADKNFTFTRNMTEFRKYASKYVANDCEKQFPEGQDYHYSIGMSYILDGMYQDAQNHFEEVLTKRSDVDEYVLYNIGLWESLYALGSLEDGEELMIKIRKEYQEKLKNESLGPTLRAQYEQWYYISDFWVAFIRYAFGNAEGALQGFRAYSDRATAKEHEERAKGKELSPVIRIYRDFRAKDFIHFLENYQGQSAKEEFDDRIQWVANGSLSIEKSKGKILAVLFRQPQNTRAISYLRHLNELAAVYRDDLAVATLGFIPKGVRAAGQQARFENFRNELKSLGITYPAGFDMTDNTEVFRGLNAVVGTASIIVFDENGRPAWYHVDPTENDVNLLDRVIGRLIRDKKGK